MPERNNPSDPASPSQSARRRYEGRVAVVTGAGSGIGKAIAEQLSAEGATVLANDLKPEGLAELTGANIHTLAADVTDPATAGQLVDAAKSIGSGRIDALFNNAGISVIGPAETFAMEDWRRVMDVNLDAAFRVAISVGQVMIDQGGGAILNTASPAGMFGIPNSIAYVVSKHGLVGLTRGLAVEWGQYGVRVNAICPGLTATGMNTQLRAERPERWSDREARTPLRRGGEPSDQAATALFLNSDDASYTTGQIAEVDGGQHALYSGYTVAFK
ncbi:MAG: family NAD(P)-dependent oxidoreductase [Pseudarthrobacter sp.]|nr:family NAD(P)-dependent oxidoreductase [Pseudarthrobacter sp.]